MCQNLDGFLLLVVSCDEPDPEAHQLFCSDKRRTVPHPEPATEEGSVQGIHIGFPHQGDVVWELAPWVEKLAKPFAVLEDIADGLHDRNDAVWKWYHASEQLRPFDKHGLVVKWDVPVAVAVHSGLIECRNDGWFAAVLKGHLLVDDILHDADLPILRLRLGRPCSERFVELEPEPRGE